MQRTCESIARLKIEHKQRTKCCNLQHFALSAGKNPRKYHSFSPRMWLNHCYLQGFVHVTIFDCLGNMRKYKRFLHSSRQKIGSKSAENVVIYRGLAPPRAKNCVNTSVSASKSGQNTAIYSVSCLPRFLEIAKNCVNTSIFCDQPAKNAVIYSVFLLALSKTLVFAVFCASRVQKVLVFTAFSAFLHGSRKRR